METVLLQKLRILQPVKKFPAFYGPQKFIPEFTKGLQLFLSRAISIQSTSALIQIKMFPFNIIFPSTSKSLKWSLSLKFPHQTQHAYLFSSKRNRPPLHPLPVLRDLII